MSNTEVHFSSKSNEWETPKYIFDYYNQIYNFDLDAAATADNALCSSFFTESDNALEQDWGKYKNVWLNPPYGRLIGKFVKKAFEEGKKHLLKIVMLIPARVDTRWWHEYCSQGEIIFIKGRLKFVNKSFPSYSENGNFKMSPAPFPSAIVIFDFKDKYSYRKAGSVSYRSFKKYETISKNNP